MDKEKRKRRGAVRNRRGKAGETLTETLTAMLIIGLSSVLFLTMVGASGRIFQKAKKGYDVFYEKITEADNQVNELPAGGVPGEKIIVEEGLLDGSKVEVDVDVKWYGNKDYVLSYKVKE